MATRDLEWRLLLCPRLGAADETGRPEIGKERQRQGYFFLGCVLGTLNTPLWQLLETMVESMT